MTRVTCHMSPVTCHNYFFRQIGEAYQWRVCYQLGLPRLVFFTYTVSLYEYFELPFLANICEVQAQMICMILVCAIYIHLFFCTMWELCSEIQHSLMRFKESKNKPAAQVACADPSQWTSNIWQNPPIQQNRRNFWTNTVIKMLFKIWNLWKMSI